MTWKPFWGFELENAVLPVLCHKATFLLSLSHCGKIKKDLSQCFMGCRSNDQLAQTIITLWLRKCSSGYRDRQDAPGLTAQYISLRRCLLICKSLMALNSEWIGSDNIKAWAEPVKLHSPSCQQENPTGREGGKERQRRETIERR